MKRLNIVAILVLFGMLYGCGYTIVGKSTGSITIKSVAIPIFENGTTEPNIEFIFTEALRREFLKHGTIAVKDIEESDAVLKGKIVKIYSTNVAHKEANKTVESRIYVTLAIKCEDKKTGHILWQNNQMTFYRVYSSSATSLENYEARKAAVKYIAEQMALRIYDRLGLKLQ